MLTRVAFLSVSALTLLLSWLFRMPEPSESVQMWPVFVLGALALAVAAVRPGLLRGWRTWLAVIVLTALTMASATYAVLKIDLCCMYVSRERYGYPYLWIGKYAEYESLSAAPRAVYWQADWPLFLVNLWFCACAVIAFVVVIRAIGKNIARGSRSEGTSFV